MIINGKDYKMKKAVLDLHKKAKQFVVRVDSAWIDYLDSITEENYEGYLASCTEAGVAPEKKKESDAIEACYKLWQEVFETICEKDIPNVRELDYSDVAAAVNDFFFVKSALREKLYPSSSTSIKAK